MIPSAALLATPLVFITSAQTADKPKELPVTLERKLHREWESGPCIGELTLQADGTFERRHYSPGNNKLTGTWKLRWNALLPTLVLTCKTSDDSDRVGTTSEVKLIQLDDEALAYQSAGGQYITHYTRVKK